MAYGSAQGVAGDRDAPVDTRPAGAGRSSRVRELLAREPFGFLVPALGAVVLSAWLPTLVAQDTWLALVAGRQIRESGLPDDDTLTVWAQGVDWVDQQWLGQLALYGLHALGGFRLLGLAHLVVLLLAFTLALVFARRTGGSSRSTALVGAIALFVALSNTIIRTQVFAYVLFVVVFWLLASDARRPSLRVLYVLPVLVLWANVHGSAVLGAGLVLAWAVAGAIAARRNARWKHDLVRHGAVVVAAALCLLASPYALELPSYYRDVLGAGEFRELVTEWRATTFTREWPFFVLALPSLWLAAREWRRLSLFEHLALVYTLVGALQAIRNIVWFAFVAIMVIPRALDGAWPIKDAPLRPRFNVALSLTAGALAVVAVAVAAAHPSRWYTPDYPDAAARAVGRAATADRSLRVFANEKYADWLLWKEPELGGKVAYDARFELLSGDELRAISRFRRRVSSNWRAPAAGYGLVVLDPAHERVAIRTLLREPGARSLYRDEDVVVVLRPDR